jgi:FAD/FMN-containing dehydrogenase
MSELDRRELLKRAGVGAAALAAATELDPATALAGARADGGGRISPKALRALRSAVSGPVLAPSSRRYNKARRIYNKRYNNLRPGAVVQARDEADVQAVMRWANRYEVNLRARAGGHSYAGYSSTDGGGVVVDLTRLQRVRLSNGNRTAQIGAGVPLIKMYTKLAKQGVSVPGGSCPTVGISGLALGGGMGFASRKHGLTCDSITGVSIVTPDGKMRNVSAQSNPSLLWACQGGGGGNFGIVTGFTFKTFRARKAAYYFADWPWGQASAVLEAWQKLTSEATPNLCPFFSLLAGANGPPKVHSEGQFFGSEGALRAALKPLTDVEGVQLTVGTRSYAAMMKQWAGCESESLKSCKKPNRVAFYGASDYVAKPLDSKGRDEMRKAIEERSNAGASGALLLDGYGGAINEVRSRATAFVHRDQLFCIQYYVEAPSKGALGSGTKWVKSARKRLADHVSGEAYQNYIDPNLKGWKRAYYGKNYQRLASLKTKYDPEGRLRFRQGIPPKS